MVTGVVYKTPSGERTSKAHLTIVCDGMYSVLRKKLGDAGNIRHPSYFVGLILSGAKLPHANHGHVVLAKPSPILFYPISSNEVRCLVDVPGEKLPSDMASYLRSVVAPEVPECLRAAFLEAIDAPNNIRSMQNKQLHVKPLHQPGACVRRGAGGVLEAQGVLMCGLAWRCAAVVGVLVRTGATAAMPCLHSALIRAGVLRWQQASSVGPHECTPASC